MGRIDVQLYPCLHLALDGGGWMMPYPASLPQDRETTQCSASWMSLRNRLDICKNLTHMAVQTLYCPSCSHTSQQSDPHRISHLILFSL